MGWYRSSRERLEAIQIPKEDYYILTARQGRETYVRFVLHYPLVTKTVLSTHLVRYENEVHMKWGVGICEFGLP